MRVCIGTVSLLWSLLCIQFNLFHYFNVWESFAIHTKITHLKMCDYSGVSSIDCRGVSKVKSKNEFKMIIASFVRIFVTWIIINSIFILQVGNG